MTAYINVFSMPRGFSWSWWIFLWYYPVVILTIDKQKFIYLHIMEVAIFNNGRQGNSQLNGWL